VRAFCASVLRHCAFLDVWWICICVRMYVCVCVCLCVLTSQTELKTGTHESCHAHESVTSHNMPHLPHTKHVRHNTYMHVLARSIELIFNFRRMSNFHQSFILIIFEGDVFRFDHKRCPTFFCLFLSLVPAPRSCSV